MYQETAWTIGHSTRSLEDFISVLKSFEIQCLVDIRGLPGSKRYPHFNKEVMEKELPVNQIRYRHIPKLGGRRKVKKDSKNTGWNSLAFRGYADYMETDEFMSGIRELEETATNVRTAYMCAESLWWKCHRSLVSDFLKLRGWKIMHILGEGKCDEHRYTSPAKIVEGKLVYER